MEKLEHLLELGGVKKDIAFLAISAVALIISIFDLVPLPFDAAWIAIILCGLPIIAEAVIGLVTRFDIKADVLVSIALIASVIIGEDFAAGEVAFIMQLGALLEDLTVARARAGGAPPGPRPAGGPARPAAPPWRRPPSGSGAPAPAGW